MPKSISKIPKESSFNNQLSEILHNSTEGAGFIEKAATELILSILELRQPDSKKIIIDSINQIRNRFAAMANIVNLSDFVCENIRYSDIGVFKLMLHDYISISSVLKEITILNCGDQLGRYGTIFTLSNSSIIRESILYARYAGWNGKVMIIESRPKNEGTILAVELAKRGIKVELGVDTLMSQMIARSDAIFLGADAIKASFFVNKIGSQNAVDCASKLRKPIFVAADKSKIISDQRIKSDEQDNPLNEISDYESKYLTIKNPYFEKVRPKGDFHYICGTSLYRPSEIRNLLK